MPTATHAAPATPTGGADPNQTTKDASVNRTLKTFAAAASLTTALVITGCSSDDSMSGHQMPASSATGSGTAPEGQSTAGAEDGHNQADITFASSMVPHHQQAIEMADLALVQASSGEVRRLATQIKAAQGPEIASMTGWLTGWGAAPMPSGHDMGGMGMDGMMTAQEMSALKDESGTAFDRMWLQMMIRHHEGAVSMARTQLSEGRDPGAKTLARAVIDGQTKEIATMAGLLKASM